MMLVLFDYIYIYIYIYINLNKAKLYNHSLGFGSVSNRPPEVLILQYNHLKFLNW